MKANKVMDILQSRCDLTGAHLLDVGAGSGEMARTFSARVGAVGRVIALDVQDQRQLRSGYSFLQATASSLPFPDRTFDIVVSNHVVEHVGESSDQEHHFAELARVLKDSGLAYVAVPNRWRLFEAHYRLPLLSWLPASFASRYVRALRRASWYDVRPLSGAGLDRGLKAAGLEPESCTAEATRLVAREDVGRLARIATHLPPPLLRIVGPIVPTHVRVARKASSLR